MQTALARLIDAELERRRISRSEFAQALRITPVSVSRWFRKEGDCPIPWRHYPAISEVVGIPLHRVLLAAEKDSPNHVELFYRFVFHVRSKLTGQSVRTVQRVG